MNRVTYTIIALLGGASSAVIAWLLLVPWDLSEIDASGAVIEGGGDDNAAAIAAVAFVVVVLGLLLILGEHTRPRATAFTFAGLTAWTLLFAWRAGSARVSGANLFIIPLIFAVIPTAVIAPLIVRSLTQRRSSRASHD